MLEFHGDEHGEDRSEDCLENYGEVFVFDAATGAVSSAEGGEVSLELLEFLALLGEE
jgi:hypothetical protein